MNVETLGRRLFSALDRHALDEIEDLAHPELRVQVGSLPAMTYAQWRTALGVLDRSFPDGRHVIEEGLVTGSHFITRCRFEATHEGAFAGAEPTGRTVSVKAIHVDRFEDDLLIEHNGNLDMLGLLTQIGAIPLPPLGLM